MAHGPGRHEDERGGSRQRHGDGEHFPAQPDAGHGPEFYVTEPKPVDIAEAVERLTKKEQGAAADRALKEREHGCT